MTHEYPSSCGSPSPGARRRGEHVSDPPDRDTLLSLHARLRSGDRLASEALMRLLLARLVADVARGSSRVDEQLIADGVTDALLDYAERPGQFDAGRGVPLDRFLAAAARRNVANLLRGERRRKARERKVGLRKREADVAQDPAAGNTRQEDLEAIERRRAAMDEALTSPEDREVLGLILDGVKETAAFARILGLAHLPADEQRREVRRHKDRITRFLRRKGLLS